MIRRTIEGYLEVGRRLIEAKAGLPHGQWGPYLARAGAGPRMASRLMKIARTGKDAAAFEGMTLIEAERAAGSKSVSDTDLTAPVPALPEPAGESYFKRRYRADPEFRAKRKGYTRAYRQRRKLRNIKEGEPIVKDAERQLDYAKENDAIADRLEADGLTDVAKAYRFAAKEHRECAERITQGALQGFFDGLNERLAKAKDGDGKE